MKNICPNLSNPEVARVFLELVNATTEKAAYHIWSANNGYSIDKAPNGAESKLFKDLLNLSNGDRNEAIRNKAKIYKSGFINWFGDWINDPANASKVVDENGEPLVVYHGTNIENISIFDRTQIPEEQTLVGTGTATFGNFFSNKRNDAKSFADITRLRRNSGKATVYDTFLNIKNPMYFETLGDFRDYSYKEGHYNENGDFVSDVKLPKEYDGVIVKRRNSKDNTKEFVAPNSNQIKSATKNNGDFSTEINDIYHNLEIEDSDILQYHINELRDSGVIHKLNGVWFITKSTGPGRDLRMDEIAQYCAANNIEPIFTELKNSTVVSFHKIDHGKSDEISKEQIKDEQVIASVLDFFMEKVPALRSAEKKFETAAELRAQGFNVPRNATAFVYNGVVHLIKGKATKDSAIEECLHPIVATIQEGNPSLFNQLYEEAKKKFPKLKEEIDIAYSDKNGFNIDTRKNELVTQALTRHTREKLSNEERKSWNLIAHKFWSYVAAHINRIIVKFGGNNFIRPEELPRMSLSELADLITTKDIKFDISKTKFSDKQMFNLSTEELSDKLDNLYKLYDRSQSDSVERRSYKNKIYETLRAIRHKDDLQSAKDAFKLIYDIVGVLDDEGKAKEGTVIYRLENNSQQITAKDIVEMWEEVINPLNSIRKQLPIKGYIPVDEKMQIGDGDNATEVSMSDVAEQINTAIQYARSLWVNAMRRVVSDKISEIIDNEVEADAKTKEDMKIVALNWAFENTFYGDISSFNAIVGNYGYSNNPIIKQAFHLIQDAETRIIEECNPNAQMLTKLFRKANRSVKRYWKSGWQTIFQEKDRDGVPTGYFIRPINHGQYKLDYDAFISEMNDAFDRLYGHHYERTSFGNYINSETGEEASSEQWVNGEQPIFVKYLKSIERFKCDKLNRKYNYAYYEEMLSEPWNDDSLDPDSNTIISTRGAGYKHGLSPDTYEKYTELHSHINYYLNQCTDQDTGISHPERLDPESKRMLELLNSEMEYLSNPYNEDGTPKFGDAKRMAYEIRAWQRWIGEQSKPEINWAKFNEELEKVKLEALQEGNPRLVDDFIRNNCALKIHPDYIEQSGLFNLKDQSTALQIKIQMIKAALQHLVSSNSTTEYTRDLRKMMDNPQFFLDCKIIDLAIEDASDKTKKGKKQDKESPLFSFDYILYRDENGYYEKIDEGKTEKTIIAPDEKNRSKYKTWYSYLLDYYTDMAETLGYLPGIVDKSGKPIALEGSRDEIKIQIEDLLNYTYTYENQYGVLVEKKQPLSIFKLMIPTQEKFINSKTGKEEDTILLVPKGLFAEKSGNPEFINDQYSKYYQYTDSYGNLVTTDEIMPEYPKQEFYDNIKEYEEMRKDKDVSELYDSLIETMKGSRKNYDLRSLIFDYLLPGMNADTGMIMSRFSWSGYKHWFSQIRDLMFSVQENDEEMRRDEDAITNPDGSKTFSVPRRYVGKLQDRLSYTSDVTASVIAYQRAAVNFKIKSSIEKDLKSMLYAMQKENREEGAKEAQNSIRLMQSMLDKHLYDRQWVDLDIDIIAKRELKIPIKNKAFNFFADVVGGSLFGGLATLPIGSVVGGVSLLLGGSFLGPLLITELAGLGLGAVTGLGAGISQFSNASKVARGKFLRKIQRASSLQMLGFGFLSMIVGFLDSTTRAIGESLMMRYMTPRDYLTGIFHTIIRLPAMIVNISNPRANNKMTALMLLNGISKSFSDTYHNVARGRFKKIASLVLMGGFTLFDYLANCILLGGYYSNIRYYEDPKGQIPTGFYSRYELQQEFAKVGRSKKEAWLAHTMLTTTLFDAYQYKDGVAVLSEKYKPFVSQKTKTRIRTKTMQRAALMNGMNPDNDIPIYKLTILGIFIGAMRGWLTQQYQHLFSGLDDTSVRLFEDEPIKDNSGNPIKNTRTGRIKTLLVIDPRTEEQEQNRMTWNYETGTPQAEVAKALWRSIKMLLLWFTNIFKGNFVTRKLSNVEIYAWKDAIITLSLLISGCMFYVQSVRPWAKEGLDKAKEIYDSEMVLNPYEYYNNGMFQGLVGGVYFRLLESKQAVINPITALDIVNAISVNKSAFDEWGSGLEAFGDVVGVTGKDPYQIVNRGAYKGSTRMERGIFKTIGPLDNIHTFTNPHHLEANWRYYENKFGTVFRLFGYDFKDGGSSETGKSYSGVRTTGRVGRSAVGRSGSHSAGRVGRRGVNR